VIVAPPRSATVHYPGSGQAGGYTPAELREAYGLPEHGGAGETVAVVAAEGDVRAQSDLKVYRKEFGLPECTKTNKCFKQLNEKGESHKPQSTYWYKEISLDLDMVSAACPECHIALLEAGITNERGLLEANEVAVDKLGAVAVSNSWNLGYEAGNPANTGHSCEIKGTDQRCLSSQEEEVDDPFLDHPGTPILFAGGDDAYAVRYPADSQYVISVGGTALRRAANARGWSEEVWFEPESLGRLGTGSGCSVFEPKPSWQLDTACEKRLDNDVAADGAVETPVAVYAYGKWEALGGTSAATPFVAGIEALSSSEARARGAETMWLDGARGELNDVTVGHNGVCTPPAEDALFCEAQLGYDGPTGNGTPNGPFTG
jgi:subtilase family serine protease